jgi:UDP-N-acetylmuramoylalanine-D-glutamate ligase
LNNFVIIISYALKMQGKLVMSELDFAAEVLPKSIKILAVTGTNGKSTVVTFAGQVFYYLFSLTKSPVQLHTHMHICT